MTEGASPAAPTGRHGWIEGLVWALAGLGILVLSIRMDRLAEQGVPPFAAPGLLPGLLGAAMIVSGTILVFRARSLPSPGVAASDHGMQPAPRSVRTLIVIGLCLVFSFALIGHGLPFWFAAALFVAASILVLNRDGGGTVPSLRQAAFACAIGLGAGLLSTVIFQNIFLVRLP